MLISFKEYVEKQEVVYSNEIPILKNILKIDLISQVEKDIELHKKTISNKTFGDESNNFLHNDNKTKRRLIEIFKGYPTNPEEIKKMIEKLEYDRSTHEEYLNSGNFSQITGSKQWHETWIKVYNGWIKNISEKNLFFKK